MFVFLENLNPNNGFVGLDNCYVGFVSSRRDSQQLSGKKKNKIKNQELRLAMLMSLLEIEREMSRMG